MIKIKLAPEEDGKYKSAHAIGNNIEIKHLSGAQLKDIISSSVESDNQLNFLRKLAKQFKAITITIDKKG
jgi:O-succinylbenzoate synthase